ncbi:AAA family ATPase [Candidatus Dojkabacteria bacterium]|nr:AAA family ATPase [Candidatus Dojkabacteria bacterium]
MKKYIAIVGTIAAGKTTACKYFQQKGYIHYKLSQGIYDEADKRGLDRTDRVILQDLGDELRENHGVDVLAKIIIKKIKKDDDSKKYVFDSIRNHNEILTLQKAFGKDLVVIAIDAPIKLRYKRAVERKGQYKEQNLTFQEFKKNNDRDLGKGNAENEQNVIKCISLADYNVQNTGSLKQLKSKLDKISQKENE